MSDIDIPTEYLIHLNPVHLSGGIALGINGGLILDAGLDDINVHATGDPTKPITVDLGLDNINVAIEPLKITLDPIQLKLDPVKVDLGLDNVNVCLSLAITQFPKMRVHVPTKYDFGVCLLGIPLVKFSVSGETMLVTQDNPPRLFQKVQERQRLVGATDIAKTQSLTRQQDASSSTDEPFRVGIE